MRKAFSLLLACMMLFSLAAAAEALFTPGEPHASHLDFRLYFKTMTAVAGKCTVSIQETVYQEDTAAQLYAQIAADEAALADLLSLQEHTVYIVKDLPAGLQRIGTAVYCSAQTILDGSYRPYLAEAACNTERWQSIGLAGLAFGTETDPNALAEWYATDAHDDMLSLFHAYFVPEFASADELHMAEMTAVSLAAHMAEKDGVSPVLTAATSDYIPGWLASIGVDRTCTDPYDGLLDGYTWTKNQFYPLIATSPKGDVFKLNPLYRDMNTPAQVRKALCDLELAVDDILAGIQQDAPDYYPILLKNYEVPITYEFGDSNYSITYHDNRRITIGSAVSMIHETAHMIAPCYVDRISRYMDTWKVEALAEYLSLTYYPSIIERETAYLNLRNGIPQPTEDELEIALWHAARDIYLQHAPMPATPQDVNVKLWYRAQTEASRQMDVAVRTVSSTYEGAGSASLELMNGNELSYTEAEWFACHLIHHYGLDAFLDYCMDKEGISFEEAFGLTYSEAKEQWLAQRTMTD